MYLIQLNSILYFHKPYVLMESTKYILIQTRIVLNIDSALSHFFFFYTE